jgi:protein disulfide-isomerase
MRSFFLTLCISIIPFAFAPALMAQGPNANRPNQTNQIRWYTNYNQAVQEAQKTRLPLFLFFTGSDWCGWCKKMQTEVLSSPDFIHEMGNSFIFVDIDFPKGYQLPPEQAQQNNQLKQKYAVTGFPTIVILDSNQNFVVETSYRAGGGKAYAEHLRQLMQQ